MSTVKDFRLPDLGEGLTESEIVTWKVAVGDTVALNQIIAEVETAKALVELPSPYAGVIAKRYVDEGTMVTVGEPIIAFDVADEGDGADAAPEGDDADAPIGAEPGDEDGATAAGEGTGAVARDAVLVGYGPVRSNGTAPRRKGRRWGDEGGGGVPGAGVLRVAEDGEGAPSGAERPRSTPPVRKLAHDLGVELDRLVGTGDGGLITRDDVQRAADGSAEGSVAVPGERRIPVKGVRKATADAMVRSVQTAPQATEFMTVDVTESLELLRDLDATSAGNEAKATILSLVAKVVTVALRRSPALNSRWDEGAGEIVEFDRVNLGIAVATERGLLVPNIRGAETLTLAQLAEAIAGLAVRARAGKTALSEFSGGTFSLTNIGVFGVDAGAAILNPGEAAILSLGAIRRQPWEHDGGIALREVMTIGLTFDHRIVDGAEASRFLVDIARLLQKPGRAIALV